MRKGSAEATRSRPDELIPSRPAKPFITEVDQLKKSTFKSDGNEGVRAAEGATEVFQLIDKLAEKQQRSKRIRTMMQRAAHKTILVVRTKNSIQAAEIVTIRFNPQKVTEVPRIVQLQQICNKVLRHARFGSAKKRAQFQSLFTESREVDALLKDMFWYITAHCFQPGRQPHLEDCFYQRIADSFTSLFVRLQMKKTSRDSGFFDQLPDVIAQILFVALYEAFPRSRKDVATEDMKRQILRTCYCWVLGFVPADLSCDHWLAIDQDSPKRIAALADFPAMRNRMMRAERVERTRQAVKTWHEDQDEDLGEVVVPVSVDHPFSDEHLANIGQDGAEPTSKALPLLQPHPKQRRNSAFSIIPVAKTPTGPNAVDAGGKNTSHVETRERFTYEMCHSPLIGAFLSRHQLEANAPHLRVQMRLTSGKQRDLNDQEALRAAAGVVPARRRRLVDPTAFGDALVELQSFGNAVRQAYSNERERTRSLNSRERRRLASAHRVLETQYSEIRQSGERTHAFSNQLVSKANIDALVGRPSSRGSNAAGSSANEAVIAGSADATRALTPHPPPPRRGASYKSTTSMQAAG